MRKEAASAAIIVVGITLLLALAWFFLLNRGADSQQDPALKEKLQVLATQPDK